MQLVYCKLYIVNVKTASRSQQDLVQEREGEGEGFWGPVPFKGIGEASERGAPCFLGGPREP